jgi:arylsulfatase A-like enzyme
MQAPEAKIAQFASIKEPKRRTYAAMVSAMDDQIGRLLETLEDRGHRNSTLVVFLSDNGGPEHANASDNGPLRGQKGDVYEGGIHVPFVMCMPGTLPSGTVYTMPVMSLDVSQTALEIAGAASAENSEAVNLFPYVLGQQKTSPHEALFWRTAHDGKQAVRRGDDKLVVLDGESSLFDLASDLGESNDLAASNAKMVVEISELFRRWNAKNKPALFPSYREYHKLLKNFHEQVLSDAQENDQPVQDTQ